MAKVQNISEIHPTLGFTEFDVLEKYRKSFHESEFVSYFLVCLPAAYLFGFVCQGGAMGIWWGFPIGLTLAGVMFYSRFRYKMKNSKIV